MNQILDSLRLYAQIKGVSLEQLLSQEYGIVSPPRPHTTDDRPLVIAVGALLESNGPWRGDASILLKTLQGVAERLQIDTSNYDWPRSPAWLVRRLKNAKLHLVGIEMKVHRTNRQRTISLSFSEDLLGGNHDER